MKDTPEGSGAGKTRLMGSFGENLRREREMRGVTLEEISAATKISIPFLKSIENEEFSRLPGGLFNRSFVRAYARYLGLDEDPLLEEYQLASKAKSDFDLSHFSPPSARLHAERPSRHTLWAVTIAASLLVLGFTLWRHSNRQVEVPKTAKNSTAPHPAKENSSSKADAAGIKDQPVVAKPTGGGVLAATSSVQDAAPKLPPVTDTNGKLILQIAATERSWVAIDSDGKSVMQGVMDANTMKTFKANASFDVLTGNAQGVILSLNGQTIQPLGREGEVKQVHLTSENLKKQNSE